MKEELKVDIIVWVARVLMEALWLAGVMFIIHYLDQWERWFMAAAALVMIARRWRRILGARA